MSLTIDTARYGLLQSVIDQDSYDRSVARFREAQILLPTMAQLADPSTIPASIRAALAGVDRDAAHPLNLFRVHWYNSAHHDDFVDVPEHIELPGELTGVDARIVAVFGNRFPMINAHKVLAAYNCLVPRVVSGQFDPTRHRAIWPSTGNYCRGGVAISRIMGCRGVAVLPEGMSRERFEWLERWVPDPTTSSARPARRATSRRSTTPATSSRRTRTTSSSTSSRSSRTTSGTTPSPAAPSATCSTRCGPGPVLRPRPSSRPPARPAPSAPATA
jgi:hypothetical protein